MRLDRAETCIGRHETNDVVVPAEGVPDVAAVLIDRGAQRFKLRDLTGGAITVNDSAVEDDEMSLDDGDRIGIGGYVLQLRLRRRDDAPAGPTKQVHEFHGAAGPGVIRYRDETIKVKSKVPFNIGGDLDNDLVIKDDFISAFHCRITCKDGRWFLTDLGSTNGTKVNGLKVGDAELPTPAKIQIGQARLTFEGQSAEDIAEQPGRYGGMIGVSPPMRRVFRLIEKLADADAPVLVHGDSGSGKELVARALHDVSVRKKGPFLALNCGALASSIIETELFGHDKGAFTGASADKKGAFEAAQNGTLFLDEVGEMPLELQPKLLRALEARTVRRVGGTTEIPINTRIIAATHRNLRKLVEQRLFREDLFHRLYVLTIHIPPLQKRPEDVLPLARHFLRIQAPGRDLTFTKAAEALFQTYAWPGNVRELKNVILRAVLLGEGTSIDENDLEFSSDAFGQGARKKSAVATVRKADKINRERILEVLAQTKGNRAEAARILGLSKSTFHDRLRRFAIIDKASKH